MKKLADNDLLELVKKDNHIAFAELVNRYWEGLYRHVCKKIKNREEAQDIIQDIFLGLWKNRLTVTCDTQNSLSSYVYKSAKYASINYFSRPGITITGAHLLEQVLSFPSAQKTDDDVLYKELNHVVDAELNGLPDRLLLPYKLSRDQHMSIKEIATSLSVSEQTVKNNISAVLYRIRFRLGKYNSDITILFIIAAVTYVKQPLIDVLVTLN